MEMPEDGFVIPFGTILPSLEPFSKDRKGQSVYATMVGCIVMHFIGEGSPPTKMKWEEWKDLYYMASDYAGLTENESAKFLDNMCVALTLLGIIVPPPDDEVGVPLPDPDTSFH